MCIIKILVKYKMPTHSLYLTTNIHTTIPEIPIFSAEGGDTTITMTFSPNDDGGTPITGYQYSFDGFITNTAIGVNSSPFTITGLETGITFDIELRAVNKNGYGIQTNSDDITLLGTIPSQPIINSVTPLDRSVEINFTAGNNNGYIIRYYILTYSSDNFVTTLPSTPIQINTPNSNPYQLPGNSLINGIPYKIKLVAHNDNGDSQPTTSESFTPSTTPSAPTFSVASGNGFATLSNFITANNGGSAVINYQFSSDNGLNFTAFSPAQTTGSYVITPLTNGQTFQIQMKAVNGVGPGTPTISQPVTPDSPVNTLINQYTTSIWLDTTTPSSNFILNGDNVITWKDKTSNGFNLTSVNKSNYISTSPTSVLISTGAYFGPQNSFNILTPLQTWFFVVSSSTSLEQAIVVGMNTSGSNFNAYGFNYVISTTRFYIYDHGSSGDGIGFNHNFVPNTKYLFSISFNINTSTSYTTAKVNSIMRLNGTTKPLISYNGGSSRTSYSLASNGATTQLLIGALNVGGSIISSKSFNIHELIGIGNQALGINDIQTIETYLNTKWNLGYTIT